MWVFSHTLFPNHSRPSPESLYSGNVRKVGIVSVDSSSGVGYRCSRNNGVGNGQVSVFQAALRAISSEGGAVLGYTSTSVVQNTTLKRQLITDAESTSRSST